MNKEPEIKKKIKSFLFTKSISDLCWRWRTNRRGGISKKFWTERYKTGGNSGPGSYGRLAHFKTRIINNVIERHSIGSVIDFGCGDGNQIRAIKGIPYLGIDISPDSVRRCRSEFSTDSSKQFLEAKRYNGERADMAMSLDVVFHLVEDDVFNAYMNRLFDAAHKTVLIYSSNFDQICINPFAPATHVRHRAFTNWVKQKRPGWKLVGIIENPYKLVAGKTARTHSAADFYLFSQAGFDISAN